MNTLDDISCLELLFHLLLVLVCLLCRYSREVLAAVGKDDRAAGVHEQATVIVHTVLANLLE